MKEIGKEIIEISGVEYTLFLNRKGIVAWEKFAKNEAKKVKEFTEKVSSMSIDEAEITNETNPFAGLEEIDNLEENQANLTLYFQKLYWIMMYENHKLTFDEVKEIYNKACEEYGEEQLIALGTQMLQDANINSSGTNELKNLKALRPAK